MKLIYLIAIASIVGSTLTAGVTKFITPVETKTPYRILFEAYASNPAGTVPHVETAVAECVPEAADIHSVNATKIIASAFIYGFDSLRKFPKDREGGKAELQRRVEQTITPLMKTASLEDQALVASLVEKAAASKPIQDCIVATSNLLLLNPEATAKPLFSDIQLRGI